MSAVADQIDDLRDNGGLLRQDPTPIDTAIHRDAQLEDRPDLSIIVVTHNRTELALSTLRSARAAIRDLAVEWFVVDSGSTDGTPEAIESEYADVRVLREENIGFAAANNRALRHTRGRYVLLLNPDIEIAAGTFDELVATLDTKPDVGVASVVQSAPDGSLQHSIRRFPSPRLALGEALAATRWTPLRHWREEELRAERYQAATSVDWLVGAFLIARAEALADVGPLDERFFLYSEEIDWCYRFRRAGWTVSHLPVMTVTHHTGHAPRPDLSAQLSYAKILFANKHYGKFRSLGIRAGLVLRHVLRACGAGLLSLARPQWTARAIAERHALAVVLGLAEPPFVQQTKGRAANDLSPERPPSLGDEPNRDGPPRVLIVNENGSVPADRRVWDISTALVREGYEVLAICPQGDGDEDASRELRDGVDIHRYPATFSSGGVGGYAREYGTALWHIWRLVKRLSDERRFDIVHACNPPDFLLFAAWPARRKGARLVFDHHDLTPELFLSRFGEEHRWLYRLTLLLERSCFAVADVVLSTNESYRHVACTRGHKRPEEVFVVRNGPDLRRFRPVAPDPSLKRGKPLLIAYVGLMAPQDGVDHALRALALLSERRNDWHAVFAGEGDARTDLERLTVELGLQDRVEFVGWLRDEQIARLLSSADLCLAPEPRSPLNDVSTMVKIAEYMAMSCPVVAYDLRESRFAAGEAAVYATPNEVASYALRIEELLADPGRRAEMAQTGRERVERELSWEHSESNLVAAYRCALNSRRPSLTGTAR
jgi:GT2 family glycosyltransferase/glycosyltransferase involved in cell wall biosynthesis